MGIDLRPAESQALDLLKRLSHQASSAQDQPSRFHREPTWPRDPGCYQPTETLACPGAPSLYSNPPNLGRKARPALGPKGSLLDHTCFQLRILLQEKRKCCSHFPSSLSCLPLQREKLFKGGGPIHSEGSQADRKAPSPLGDAKGFWDKTL